MLHAIEYAHCHVRVWITFNNVVDTWKCFFSLCGHMQNYVKYMFAMSVGFRCTATGKNHFLAHIFMVFGCAVWFSICNFKENIFLENSTVIGEIWNNMESGTYKNLMENLIYSIIFLKHKEFRMIWNLFNSNC